MRHCKQKKIQYKWLEKSLIRSIVKHGRIVTTQTRAKLIRRPVEKMITQIKKWLENTQNSKDHLTKLREFVSYCGPESLKSIQKFYPYFKERAGGYTRIVKLESRKGDNADMAVISIVGAFND